MVICGGCVDKCVDGKGIKNSLGILWYSMKFPRARTLRAREGTLAQLRQNPQRISLGSWVGVVGDKWLL